MSCCFPSLSLHQRANICVSLHKCAQVRFKAKVFSYKHFKCFQARIKISNNMTGKLESKRERRRGRKRNWDVRRPRCFWLYITGYLQLCRCVCLSGVDSELLGPGRDGRVLCGSCRGWAVWMVAPGYCRLEVWARNSCSLRVMTTCAPFGWFTDAHDLSSLEGVCQDKQDALAYPKHTRYWQWVDVCCLATTHKHTPIHVHILTQWLMDVFIN